MGFVAMDFGALSPEVNSGKMYAGPGSASIVAAAAAWDALAAELRSTADSYVSVIAGLTGESWLGPSSASMAAAAAPYAAWLSTTAVQAEQTATQARAAAAAYESAFAATIPPPVIAANRSQLASLVATNIVGQNTAAIAAIEALYADMWAHDAAVMYGYAGQSAAASGVTPFAAAPQTTNPGGVLGQLATAAQAAGTGVGTSTQSQLSGFVSAAPTALQSLASPAPSSNSLSSIAAAIELIPKLILPANDALITVIFGLAAGVRALTAAQAGAGLGSLAAGLGSTTHVAGAAAAAGAGVSAGLGRAGVVGALSVPPSWATATPTIRLAASVLQSTGVGAAPAAVVDGSGSLLGGMALAGMAGSAVGAAAPRAVTGAVTKVGRPTVDKESQTPEKLKRALAEMSQTPESVQHWHTDEAQLESLLAQLSKKPGMHAVHLKKRKPGPPKAQPS